MAGMVIMQSMWVFANQADMDAGFETRGTPWFEWDVSTTTEQSDGKIIVGWTFTSYQWTPANSIIRLNSDGSRDTSFAIGSWFNDTVNTIAIQSDGKIIVGWMFTSYQWSGANGIIRLNANGSRDNSFDIGDWFYRISSIVIQSDNKILIWWFFNNYKWVPANNIIRLNADWSRDNSFIIGSGFNSDVSDIKIQSDDKIIIGGSFTSYQWTTANRIIRLNSDGSIDTSFAIGSWFNNSVSTIAIQPDEKILVGGWFTSYQWSSANRIIRLNSDWSIDTSFAIGSGFNDPTRSIAIQSDDKIIVWGYFTTYQWSGANKIIRLNTNGSKDTSFDIGSGFGGNWLMIADIITISIQTNGKIIVGWKFDSYNKIPSKWISRLNNTGEKDTSFDNKHGFNGSVLTSATQDDGKILVGWTFTYFEGVPTNRIVRLNTDGSIDTSFAIGSGFNDKIYKIKIQDDGKVLVWGFFTNYNGTSTRGIIRLNTDGSRDTSFAISNKNSITDFVLQSDGKIVIVSYFNGEITRLHTNGSIDTSFNTETPNGIISSIAIQSDGKMIIGGEFNNISAPWYIDIWLGGMPYGADYCASDSNITDQESCEAASYCDDGSSPDQATCETYVCSDPAYETEEDCTTNENTWYLRGTWLNYWYTRFFGNMDGNIIRFNSDWSIDTSFAVGPAFDYSVMDVEIQDDGKILVWGTFQSYNYDWVPANNIIRLNSDGSRDISFDMGDWFKNIVSSINKTPYIYTISKQDDGKILVWGEFTEYDWVPANSIIRLNSDGSRDISFDIGDGFIPITEKTSIWTYIYNSVYTTNIGFDGHIFIGGNFGGYNWVPAGYFTSLYGNSPVVDLPASSDQSTVNTAFMSKWYTESNWTFVGTTPISLAATDGNIPLDLSIQNNNITVTLDANTKFEHADSNIEYTGLIYVPSSQIINTVNNEAVISSFNVGNNSGAIELTWGLTTISLPALGQTIGQAIQVSYSNDNWISWISELITQVIDKNGVPTVEFSTDHFADFALTLTADTISPVGTISYNTTGTTANDVVATLSLNEAGTITNNNGNTTYTFTDNGSFTFEFTDTSGNTGSTTATVNWIDKTTPIGTISYNTTGSTANDVIATLNVNEPATITNNNGLSSYTFTDNGSFTFEFVDTAWNTGSTIATVNWINKTVADTGSTTTGSTTTGWGSSSSSNTSSNSSSSPYFNNPIPSVIDEIWELLHGAADEKVGSIKDSRYPTESNNAYLWAYKMGITKFPTIQQANLDGKLYRSHLAKMISEYAVKQLKKTTNTGANCIFSDMTNQSTEMKVYAQAACQLGLMGLKSDGTPDTKFNPTAEVTRAQFGTTLSRLLYGASNNEKVGGERYTSHLNALKAAGIMTKIEKPTMDELRGNVFLMLMRTVK